MEDKEILEFIQEVSRPLSYRLYWQIPRQNNTTYQVDVDAMELAFEMSISDSLNADNSYINQLPEIKERLNDILSKLQRRRYRYEKVANELKDNLPILSIRQKYTREQQRDADNLSHFRNIIGQFRLVLEPNIKKAIKYIDKKLEESKAKQSTTIVVVSKTKEEVTKSAESTAAPFYRDVKYDKEQLGDIYKIVVFKEGLLKNTSEEDFEYYFSGIGKQPTHLLEKQDKTTWIELIVFIKEIMLDRYARCVWNTTESVFKGTKQTTLKSTYSRDRDSQNYEDFKKKLLNSLKDIPTK